MKKLLILSLLLSATFSVSQAQTVKDLQALILSLWEQTQQQQQKLLRKDTIIAKTEQVVVNRDTTIASMKRDSATFVLDNKAYREGAVLSKKEIKKLENKLKKRTIAGAGIGGVLLFLLILSLL